jgi:hypothetical protein
MVRTTDMSPGQKGDLREPNMKIYAKSGYSRRSKSMSSYQIRNKSQSTRISIGHQKKEKNAASTKSNPPTKTGHCVSCAASSKAA